MMPDPFEQAELEREWQWLLRWTKHACRLQGFVAGLAVGGIIWWFLEVT